MSTKTHQYTQCTLVKKIDTGTLSEVVFIPAQLAKIGKQLSIKQSDGTWDDGWVVEAKGSTLDAKYVEDHERDYKTQREYSDI